MNNNLPESNEKAVWKQNAVETGLRFLFIVLFGFIFYLAIILILVLIVFQLGHQFIIGGPNLKLKNFGRDLATFMHRVLDYMTFNADRRPFPFDDWPSGDQ